MDRKSKMTTLDEARAPPLEEEAKSQYEVAAEIETTDTTPEAEDSEPIMDGGKADEDHKVALKAAPCLDGSTILMLGLLLFLLVSMLPSIVLLASLVLAYILPHWICASNSGANRRRKANIVSRSSSNGETVVTNDEGITVEESYWFNERGMALFTKMVLPKDKQIRSILCYCHDYLDHDWDMSSSSTEQKQLVKEGIAYVCIQYEGHGKSDGPLNLIPSWEQLVGDIGAFFLATTNEEMFRGKPMFLMGKGLGGAVAYSLNNSMPYLFSGAILLNPHCEVHQELLPHKWVTSLLLFCMKHEVHFQKWLKAMVLPSATAPYAADHTDKHCYNESKLNPYIITSETLKEAKEKLSSTFSEFDQPLLICAGHEEDGTSKGFGQALYMESKSEDKVIICSSDLEYDWKQMADWIKQHGKKRKVDWIDRCFEEIEKRLPSKKKN